MNKCGLAGKQTGKYKSGEELKSGVGGGFLLRREAIARFVCPEGRARKTVRNGSRAAGKLSDAVPLQLLQQSGFSKFRRDSGLLPRPLEVALG